MCIMAYRVLMAYNWLNSQPIETICAYRNWVLFQLAFQPQLPTPLLVFI